MRQVERLERRVGKARAGQGRCRARVGAALSLAGAIERHIGELAAQGRLSTAARLTAELDRLRDRLRDFSSKACLKR
jgi:hypothetical protein